VEGLRTDGRGSAHNNEKGARRFMNQAEIETEQFDAVCPILKQLASRWYGPRYRRAENKDFAAQLLQINSTFTLPRKCQRNT
jgi:hypothetical protein